MNPSRLALLLLPIVLGAATVDDYTGASLPELFKGAERGVSCAVEDQPGGGGRLLVLTWQERHSGFHEAYFKPAHPLPGAGTLVLRARLSGAVPVWTLAARIQDAKQEMFDFVATLPPAGADGWTDLRIPVREGAQKGHWGGNPGTGHLEGALTLAGLAINGGDTAGTGELRLGAITFEAASPGSPTR